MDVSKFKKPDNSELLTRECECRAASISKGAVRDSHRLGGWQQQKCTLSQSQGPESGSCSLWMFSERIHSCSFHLLFTYGHVTLPPVFHVKIAIHLPLTRIHMLAGRTHLDNTGFSPQLKILYHTCKGPLLVGLVLCHLRHHSQFPRIRTWIYFFFFLTFGEEAFFNLPQVSFWQILKNRINGKKSLGLQYILLLHHSEPLTRPANHPANLRLGC